MGLSNDHLLEISRWLEVKLSLLNPKYLAPPDTEAMELPFMKKAKRAQVKLDRKRRAEEMRRKLLDPKASEDIGGESSGLEELASEESEDQEEEEDPQTQQSFEGLGRGLFQNNPRTSDELKTSLQEKLAAMKGARGGESSGRKKSKDKKRKNSEGRGKGSQSGYKSGNKNKKRKAESEARAPGGSETGGEDKVRLQFGSLEVADTDLGVQKKGPRKKKPTKQDLLEGAEAKAESRKKFKNTGMGGDAVMTDAWDAAMGRAKGDKVHDNPKLLKKAIKKEHKDKIRSAKKWKERKQEVEAKMKRKEERARANLKARTEKKMERRKMKRLKKMVS